MEPKHRSEAQLKISLNMFVLCFVNCFTFSLFRFIFVCFSLLLLLLCHSEAEAGSSNTSRINSFSQVINHSSPPQEKSFEPSHLCCKCIVNIRRQQKLFWFKVDFHKSQCALKINAGKEISNFSLRVSAGDELTSLACLIFALQS